MQPTTETPTPPRTVITTSRNPTQSTRTFTNDLASALPNALRITRGKSSLTTLAEKALEQEAEKIIIVDRWKGGSGRIQLYALNESGLQQHYPLIYLKNVKLRRELGYTRSGKTKTLAIQTDPKTTPEAEKLADALAQFLDIPRLPTQQTQTTIHIALNPYCRIQITFPRTPQKTEIGPRITISHLVWKQKDEKKRDDTPRTSLGKTS